MSQASDLHHWTREDYERAVTAGVFGDKRIELLHGNIVDVPPQGTEHASSVQELTELLVGALRGRAKVRIQAPFAASDDSEPEPDVAVVPPGTYRDAHPSRAWLIIESADSSLRKDREGKAEIYAQAGVEEYWVVNLLEGLIEVRTEIVNGLYERLESYAAGDTIRLKHFPDVAIAVSDVIGPA